MVNMKKHAGLTMVELMVALAISLLITLAAVAALVVARRGFDTVDSASQLRDNMRFSADLIQRLGAQTGYKETKYLPFSAQTPSIMQSASVGGFNNALLQKITNFNTVTIKAGQGVNGSDILILRSQGSAGGGVIDCNGREVADPTDDEERSVSVIHLAMSLGELSLMCDSFTRTFDKSSASTMVQPIIQGVENFQVLYGTDSDGDSVPDRFLRADQLVVAGNDVATQNNWRRVRSLRIGMVLRGPPNSQQEKVAQDFYPFGLAKASASGVVGSALSSASDTGTLFNAPADGRLRQTMTFTVHLRNDQSL